VLKDLAFKKTNNLFLQSFKYAIGGGVAFVFDFFFLYLFTSFFHVHYLTSAAVSYLIGSVVHYGWSILFVFSSRSVEKRSVEFMIFSLVGVVGLGLNEGVMWVFTEKIGLYYLYSKLVATFFVFFWNFSTRRYILFRS